MNQIMRKIMTLFDEHQSKENGKHTLRAMKENARQGFGMAPDPRSAIESSSPTITPRPSRPPTRPATS